MMVGNENGTDLTRNNGLTNGSYTITTQPNMINQNTNPILITDNQSNIGQPITMTMNNLPLNVVPQTMNNMNLNNEPRGVKRKSDNLMDEEPSKRAKLRENDTIITKENSNLSFSNDNLVTNNDSNNDSNNDTNSQTNNQTNIYTNHDTNNDKNELPNLQIKIPPQNTTFEIQPFTPGSLPPKTPTEPPLFFSNTGFSPITPNTPSLFSPFLFCLPSPRSKQ